METLKNGLKKYWCVRTTLTTRQLVSSKSIAVHYGHVKPTNTTEFVGMVCNKVIWFDTLNDARSYIISKGIDMDEIHDLIDAVKMKGR